MLPNPLNIAPRGDLLTEAGLPNPLGIAPKKGLTNPLSIQSYEDYDNDLFDLSKIFLRSGLSLVPSLLAQNIQFVSSLGRDFTLKERTEPAEMLVRQSL